MSDARFQHHGQRSRALFSTRSERGGGGGGKEKETTGGCGVGVVVGGGFPGRFHERVYTVIPPSLHIAYHLLRAEYPYGRMPHA